MQSEKFRLLGATELLMAEGDRIAGIVRPVARNPADHLVRSCESVMFNTGVAFGAIKPRVKINAYEIARKEAAEVRSILRRLVIMRAIDMSETRRAWNLTTVVMGMLTSAMKSLADRDPNTR